MADTTIVSSAPPPRRRRWLKILAGILGIFIILLVAVYFAGTSSAFFKGVILPRVSKSLNAEVKVGDASIRPFQEVTLRNLTVRTTGEEALLTAPEVRARYSLMDILRGNINVDEVTLSSPVVAVVENPDGSHNYDPLTKAPAEKSKAKETKSEKPSHRSSEIVRPPA